MSGNGGNDFHGIGLEGRIVSSLTLNAASTRLYAACYGSGVFWADIPAHP